jgi:hypothetical protein
MTVEDSKVVKLNYCRCGCGQIIKPGTRYAGKDHFQAGPKSSAIPIKRISFFPIVTQRVKFELIPDTKKGPQPSIWISFGKEGPIILRRCPSSVIKEMIRADSKMNVMSWSCELTKKEAKRDWKKLIIEFGDTEDEED